MNEQQQAAMRMALGDMQAGRVGDAMKNLRQALQQQEGRDWSLLEATQESLREHMGEIKRLSALVRAQQITIEKLEAQQQEPVAYDKTEINCFAQDLYDQKMREGKRGHYESMFHVIHQCIKKVSPPASKPWVGLTDEEREAVWSKVSYGQRWAGHHNYAKAIEAKLREKNHEQR